MARKPLRVGIIGAGEVAGWHADGLLGEPDVRILAVAEQDPKRLEAFASKYKVERTMSDWKDLLRMDDIDLVLILLPHHLHNTLVLAALRARKHVICEKPMARTVAECDSMLVEATAASRGLYISHSLRTSFFYRTATRLVAEGRIGRPILGSFRWLADEIDRLNDPRHWKGNTQMSGGAVILDGGCRVADLANGFFGAARKVAAVGRRLVAGLPGRGEDNASFLAEYASGATCSFALSFTAGMAFRKEKAGAGLFIDIFGTEGHIECGYLVRDASIQHYCQEHHPGSEETYFEPPPGEEKVIDVEFVRSILDNVPPPVTAIEARNAVAVVEAAYRSLRTFCVEEVDWRA